MKPFENIVGKGENAGYQSDQNIMLGTCRIPK